VVTISLGRDTASSGVQWGAGSTSAPAQLGSYLRRPLPKTIALHVPQGFFPVGNPIATTIAAPSQDLGFRLRRPVPVVIETETNNVIVADTITGRYATGATVEIAFDNLLRRLTEYFADLTANRGNLSPRLARHLMALEQYIQRPAE
jgi:hypothetical protein